MHTNSLSVCYHTTCTCHVHPCTVSVRDRLVVKMGAVPSCLFNRQLNHISRNNGALNLFHVPWRVPERGREVRGRRFSLIYMGRLRLLHDPVSTRLVCQLVIEEQQGLGRCLSQWISNDLSGSLTSVHYTLSNLKNNEIHLSSNPGVDQHSCN